VGRCGTARWNAAAPRRGGRVAGECTGQLPSRPFSEAIGPPEQPYLSVVVVTRNDNHGLGLTARTQCFIDTLAEGAARHGVAMELVVVEWNPPPDATPIAEAFHWPRASRWLDTRIITVPSGLHHRLANSNRIPLYQMIGKNVGIARARGQFVLATNIDILLGDALLTWLRAKALLRGCLYRAARADVPPATAALKDYDERLAYCAEHANPLGPQRDANARSDQIPSPSVPPGYDLRRGARRLRSLIVPSSGPTELGEWGLPSRRARVRTYLREKRSRHPIQPLHTVAAGDFTLLARDDWRRLRGYAEWPIYSWNIDALLLYQALVAGVQELDLGPQRVIYHVDHAAGSGWTPQHGDALFQRLEREQTPYLDDIALSFVVRRLFHKREPAINDPNWGFGTLTLPEVHFPRLRPAHSTPQAFGRPSSDRCSAARDPADDAAPVEAASTSKDPGRDIAVFGEAALPNGSGVVQVTVQVTAGQICLALQPRMAGVPALSTATVGASTGCHVIELPVPEFAAVDRLVGCGGWNGGDSRFVTYGIEFVPGLGAGTERRVHPIGLASLAAQNGGVIEAAGDDGIDLVTAPDRWVYSAALLIDLGDDPPARPSAVRVRVSIDTGAAGFLLTTKGNHNDLACSVTLSASGAEQTVYLPVTTLDAAGQFIVRNESPHGPTHLRLHAIEIVDTSRSG
jgi:hypothetical protein